MVYKKYSAAFTLPADCEWPTFETGDSELGHRSTRLVCVEQIVLTRGQLLLLGATTSSSKGVSNEAKNTECQIAYRIPLPHGIPQ